jgi:hypothetical protein
LQQVGRPPGGLGSGTRRRSCMARRIMARRIMLVDARI